MGGPLRSGRQPAAGRPGPARAWRSAPPPRQAGGRTAGRRRRRTVSHGFPNETFQEILEYNLSENLNRKICVSNAGVDGHSTYAHLISFDSWFPIIDQLNPDIYLLYVGINDAFFIGDEKNPETLNKTQKEKFSSRDGHNA